MVTRMESLRLICGCYIAPNGFYDEVCARDAKRGVKIGQRFHAVLESQRISDEEATPA